MKSNPILSNNRVKKTFVLITKKSGFNDANRFRYILKERAEDGYIK